MTKERFLAGFACMRGGESVVGCGMNYLKGTIAGTLLALVVALPFVMAGDEAELEAQFDGLLAAARDTESDFKAVYAEAEEKGLASSLLLESKVLRGLSTGDLDALLTLIPELESPGEDFRFGLGEEFTFISTLQLDGFSDALKCIDAYKKDDLAAFEKFAISSFSKAPDFNQAFGIGELLNQIRYDEVQAIAMESVGVPMDMELASVEGDVRTLSGWMGDNKALLIDFWASWCGPCIRLMPALKDKSETLASQGVFVAGVNTDRGSSQKTKAESTREKHGMESVPWLLDRNGGDLSNHLMVDSIPRMVLIDPEGNVLYNGHPSDPALKAALGKIGVTLEH